MSRIICGRKKTDSIWGRMNQIVKRIGQPRTTGRQRVALDGDGEPELRVGCVRDGLLEDLDQVPGTVGLTLVVIGPLLTGCSNEQGVLDEAHRPTELPSRGARRLEDGDRLVESRARRVRRQLEERDA